MGRFQKTLFRPIEPREVYICRSIEREWPSGEWVEEHPVQCDLDEDCSCPPSQHPRLWMLENYEEIAKYRKKYWDWKRGKRKSKPERPDL